MIRKVCVITGSRADYGIISDLLKEINKSKKLRLVLVVCNMHLQKKFGDTIKDIKKDNLKIDYIIKNFPRGNKDIDIINAFSGGTSKFGKIFKKIEPDIVLLTGDRFEMLSAAISSTYLNIPIAHIHGGELTYGSLDDYNRHIITKLSNLHFAATKLSKKRIIQLGENPKDVYHVGGLGSYNLSKEKLMSKDAIEKKLKRKLLTNNILITMHPEISENKKEFLSKIKVVLGSIKFFRKSLKIFTASNSDLGGDLINEEIIKFVRKDNNSIFVKNLGRKKYLSLMKFVTCLLGNSSSGLLEAPMFKTPVINIGDRQSGRESSDCVVNVGYDKKKIIKAVQNLSSSKFKQKVKNSKSFYYKKDTLKNILNILEKTNLKFGFKKFYDLI